MTTLPLTPRWSGRVKDKVNGRETFERTKAKFFWHPMVRLSDGRTVEIALLVRESDWRPLDAPWWKGKQVSLVGADMRGNFFLRHSDGSVRWWSHEDQRDLVVAKSVGEFAAMVFEGEGHAI